MEIAIFTTGLVIGFASGCVFIVCLAIVHWRKFNKVEVI